MTVDKGLSIRQKRKSLGNQIYEQLRDDIVYMRLKPGQMIYEKEIAERLEVSRTPVREAFRLLENEQLIEIRPQRGTLVRRISVRKVHEARFIREHLEEGAFRLAATVWQTQATADDEANLEKLLKMQEAAASENDAEELLRLDEAFHRAIMSVTQNETLLQVIGHMRAHLNRVRYLALKESRHMSRIPEEHREIMEAIRSGDAARTSVLLSTHIGKLAYDMKELVAIYEEYFDPA